MTAKIYRILVGVWLGTIVFFSGVIAPQIFKHLEKAVAANLQNQLFPLYYTVGSICGFSLIGLDLFSGRKKLWVLCLATTLAVVGFTILSPLIREAYLAQSTDMKWLHPLAVALNVLMLVCVIIAV